MKRQNPKATEAACAGQSSAGQAVAGRASTRGGHGTHESQAAAGTHGAHGTQRTLGSHGNQAAESFGRLARPLAQRVRFLRARRSLTRAQLSERSGVSLAYLARLEAGSANISLQVLEQIADALQVTPQALLDEGQDYGTDYELILDFLRRQSPQVRAGIWRWISEQHGVRPADAAVPKAAPARIALIGLRGAGKSTLGARLADRLGLPFVELNREIERVGGVAVSEVFTLYGAAGYRALERKCLRDLLERNTPLVLATGGGVVSEAANYELLRGAFRTVWLRAQPQDHFDRVRRQQDARIAAPELQQVAMANIRTMLAAREPLYALADLTLDTSGRTVTQSLTDLVQLLSH